MSVMNDTTDLASSATDIASHVRSKLAKSILDCQFYAQLDVLFCERPQTPAVWAHLLAISLLLRQGSLSSVLADVAIDRLHEDFGIEGAAAVTTDRAMEVR